MHMQVSRKLKLNSLLPARPGLMNFSFGLSVPPIHPHPPLTQRFRPPNCVNSPFHPDRKDSRSMEAQIREAEERVVEAAAEVAAATEAMGRAVAAAEEVSFASPSTGLVLGFRFFGF